MTISLQPAVSIVRWYDDGCSFELRSPYRAVCSVMHLTSTGVFIFGMHGRITKADMAALFRELQAGGVETVTAERRGKLSTRNIKQLLSKADLQLDVPALEEELQ